ncbi:MAG: hypothetical protein COA44_09600 [Arcobacter sp.]|nr:MAG: hypothetical protein COA44_09600 [Arcobacter sp.]
MTYEKLFEYTHNLSVLFVEDEASIRESTKHLLENYFHKVDTCKDGEEGLLKYKEGVKTKKLYDIVLSDINMPFLNGIEMISKIKEINSEQNVVFLSAHNDKEFLLEAIRLGISYYLLKPIILADLEKVLFTISKNIVNEKKVEKQLVDDRLRNEQDKAYKKALMQWSNLDFEDTENSLKKATEITAQTLKIGRVSIWLYNDDSSAIICKDLYSLKEDEHSSDLSLEKSMFPHYFKALENNHVMLVPDARTDPRTKEFTSSYLEPLDIYSMLDIPIMQDGKLLGIVCHEALGQCKEWSLVEQEFAMTLANNIALSLEIEKRREIQEILKEKTDLLAFKVHHDELTNLPNRSLLMDRLKQSMKKNRRRQIQFALLFIDLDRFKIINDTYGHDVGDEVLQVLTQRMSSQIREGDTLARIGGDEFTLILDDIESLTSVINVVQKLLACTQEKIHIKGIDLRITLSIGISIYPNDGATVDTLLRNADVAMYKAKEEGRNTYQYYTQEMTEEAVARIVLEAKLKDAIEDESLMVYYQPQYDAREDKLIGMEALTRWKDDKGQIIYPDSFIPLAEETGLIVPMDRLMMRQASKQFSLWYKEGLNPGKLSLNLAMKQLAQDDFIPFVKDLVKKYCKGEGWLQFEVTEGCIMEDPEASIAKLEELKKMGIGLSVDDFGTGYSSLSYLKRLPLDTLKIDRTFIKDLPNDEEDRVISKAIIALANSLHLGVVAEGVETLEQKEFLLEHGCYIIQGFYYSPAITDDEMHEKLISKGA